MQERAVIVDFDRTLLRSDKTLSPLTLSVFRFLKERGLCILAATARPERSVRGYLEALRPDACVTLNGARTLLPRKVLEHPLSPESADRTLQLLMEIPDRTLSMECAGGFYASRAIPEWNPVVEPDLRGRTKSEHVYKILASPPPDIPLPLPEDVYTTTAEGTLLQVMDRKATKWRGVQDMLSAFGLSPAQAVYFGDDQDDLESIRGCGLGVAVSNALKPVRDAASALALSNDEDGVARFLVDLFHLEVSE